MGEALRHCDVYLSICLSVRLSLGTRIQKRGFLKN